MGVVHKSGGSSVATPAHIRAVAARVARAYQQGEKIAVVASAMGKSTDQLIALASQVGENICPREMDALMATGEQKTISLLAMALQNLGVPAMSFTGAQCGMLTNTNHSRAKILQIKADAVEACVAAGKVPVVAGFQGVSQDGSITTLGRGGSDTTAVALAAALGWDCQIYTDVDSIFTADPRKCPGAKPLHRVTYEEMMEMASLGAGVLETRSVELAKKYGVKLYLGRSLEEDLRKGTYIMEWNETFEDMPVTGLSIKENCAMFTIDGLAPDGSGVSRIFELVAELDVNVDMISQQTLPSGVLASFSCSEADAKLLLGRMEAGGFPRQPLHQGTLTKLSLVGVGMRTHGGIAAAAFTALTQAGIPYYQVTTSEISISLTVDQENQSKAIRVLADTFQLRDDQLEAQQA